MNSSTGTAHFLGASIRLILGLVVVTMFAAACQPVTRDASTIPPESPPTPQPIDLDPIPISIGPEGAVLAEEMTLNDGTVINYTVVLPPNYESTQPYPTLLALPPGSQTQSMVNAGLTSYWQESALTHGWVVVSPVAPGGQLFFQGSETLLPEFLTHIGAQYPLEGGKFHLSGISNGGISAFRIAGTHPEFFHSLLALPGYARSAEDQTNLVNLVNIPVALFVGENDTAWIGPMRETFTLLNQQDGEVAVEIVSGEGHFIRTLRGDQLFGLLERFRLE